MGSVVNLRTHRPTACLTCGHKDARHATASGACVGDWKNGACSCKRYVRPPPRSDSQPKKESA